MLKRFLIFVFAGVFISATSYAEMRQLPEWQRCPIGTTIYACYTFEQARKLKLLDLEFDYTLTKLKKVQLELTATTTLAENRRQQLIQQQDMLASQARELVTTRMQRDSAVDAYDSAKKRDILGDLLPWVITGAVVLFGGGFVVGVFALKK